MDLSCTTHLVLIHKNTIIDAKSNMLSPEFLSVLEVQTRDELHREILQFARLAGFDLFTAMVVIDEPCGPPTFIEFTTRQLHTGAPSRILSVGESIL